MSSLADKETFKSQSDNALKKGTVTVSNMAFSVSLPPFSITAVLLKGNTAVGIYNIEKVKNESFNVNSDGSGNLQIHFTLETKSKVEIDLLDLQGRKLKCIPSRNYIPGVHEESLNIAGLTPGIYFTRFNDSGQVKTQKTVIH